MVVYPGPLQRLLCKEFNNDLKDVVIFEGTFVEVDERGLGIRQVQLGISSDNLLMGIRRVLNWKDDSSINSPENVDLEMDGLEIKWLTPRRMILLSPTRYPYTLRLSPLQGKTKYFELCTCEHRLALWELWLANMIDVSADSYGYQYNFHLNKKHLENTRYNDSDTKRTDDHLKCLFEYLACFQN